MKKKSAKKTSEKSLPYGMDAQVVEIYSQLNKLCNARMRVESIKGLCSYRIELVEGRVVQGTTTLELVRETLRTALSQEVLKDAFKRLKVNHLESGWFIPGLKGRLVIATTGEPSQFQASVGRFFDEPMYTTENRLPWGTFIECVLFLKACGLTPKNCTVIRDGQVILDLKEMLRDLKAPQEQADGSVIVANEAPVVERPREPDPPLSALTEMLLPLIRTRPFLILAGNSGTGKSRLVRELAYASCPEDLVGELSSPQNYELLPVKPNWHDSSELIGYLSSIGGAPEYRLGKFLIFLVHAWHNASVPFFLCLDEMNLAPVEQYMAEILSVIETRRLRAQIPETSLLRSFLEEIDAIESFQDGIALTDPLIDRYRIEHVVKAIREEYGDVSETFLELVSREGLGLPPNLVIVGTVNMDETTHGFSRKVLDRALTLEIFGGPTNDNDLTYDLKENAPPSTLRYRNTPLRLEDVVCQKTGIEGAKELIPDPAKLMHVARFLTQINKVLSDTPFQVSFRTRDEACLLAAHLGDVEKALQETLLKKILPRIEGDRQKLTIGRSNVLDGIEQVADQWKALTPVIRSKLGWMRTRLETNGYTSFWP